MDLPLSLLIESLEGFSVCLFKDKKHDPDAPSHYYISVPVTDRTMLLLCIITSQIEKRFKYYSHHEGATNSLVILTPEELPFLKMKSLLDCNQPDLILKSELFNRIDQKHQFRIIQRNIPQSLQKQIISAIHSSPLVKEFIKQLIKYPDW